MTMFSDQCRNVFRWIVVGIVVSASGMVYGQASVEGELQHLKKLYNSGHWLEAIDDTRGLLDGMEKQGTKKGAGYADTYLTFAVFQALLASEAGDLKTAEQTFREIDDRLRDRVFASALAGVRMSPGGGREEAERQRQYQLMIDQRAFFLIDSRIRDALARGDYSTAEELIATSLTTRRSSTSYKNLLSEESRRGKVVSPKTLAIVSTFVPHQQSVLLYMCKQEMSRAKTYFDRLAADAEQCLHDAFHDTTRGDNARALSAEWPSGTAKPTEEQLDAAWIHAVLEETRGLLAAASHKHEDAESALQESQDFWLRAIGGESAWMLPALLARAESAVDAADAADKKGDPKTAAACARRAERLLSRASLVAEGSLAAESPRRAAVDRLLSEAREFLATAEVNVAGLESAERAAAAALRSMAKFLPSPKSVSPQSTAGAGSESDTGKGREAQN
jgi:hypothetical protein